MNTRQSILAAVLLCSSIGSFALISHTNPSPSASAPNIGCISFVDAAAQAEANEPLDFYYKVESRFMSRMTREHVQSSRSIEELLPAQTEGITAYKRVDLIQVDEQYNTISEAKGTEAIFTEEQLAFLSALSYSATFKCHVEYNQGNTYTGINEERIMTPHITVVPEKEAVYLLGKEQMINYLKSNSSEAIRHAQKDKVQPGRIYFTVNQHGSISNVEAVSSCGYTQIDTLMHQLIQEMPGEWQAATDNTGEPVDQVLVFTYGNGGC